jgi:dipeptidyl aminopeptidase/acylaminoacyl peptidase
VVVAVHGFKGFKDWGFWPETARRLGEAGLALVTFNLSGSGVGEDGETFTEVERFERNTVTKELDDLGRVLDAVAGRTIPLGGADIRKLGLLGHSRGGGSVLLRARRDPRVQAVVTWAAVSTFHRHDAETVREWRERGFLQVVNARTGQIFKLSTAFLDDLEAHGDAYEPTEAIRNLEIPVLLIHGTRDESVPPDEANILARAAGPGVTRLALIQGAGHTFGAVHPFRGSTPELDIVLEKTIGWFRDGLDRERRA